MKLADFCEPRPVSSSSPHWRELTAWSRAGLVKLDWTATLNRGIRPGRDPATCMISLTDAGRARLEAEREKSDAGAEKRVA